MGVKYILCGWAMRFSNDLKEINIDNSYFRFVVNEDEYIIVDLNNHQETYIFHHCCKSLECVSIRNMRYHFDWRDDDKQNALIKFVRNAPSILRWFRSDLTPNNMTMLRLERLGIELLN
jgi:hypothetical protein